MYEHKKEVIALLKKKLDEAKNNCNWYHNRFKEYEIEILAMQTVIGELENDLSTNQER